MLQSQEAPHFSPTKQVIVMPAVEGPGLGGDSIAKSLESPTTYSS
jgi:hypothetical protein